MILPGLSRLFGSAACFSMRMASINSGPYCLLEIFGAGQAVAVFTAHGAAQAQGQSQNRFTDRAQITDAASRL